MEFGAGGGARKTKESEDIRTSRWAGNRSRRCSKGDMSEDRQVQRFHQHMQHIQGAVEGKGKEEYTGVRPHRAWFAGGSTFFWTKDSGEGGVFKGRRLAVRMNRVGGRCV